MSKHRYSPEFKDEAILPMTVRVHSDAKKSGGVDQGKQAFSPELKREAAMLLGNALKIQRNLLEN